MCSDAIVQKMKHVIHDFIHQNMLVNWSNLNKCILLLSLTVLQHFLWMFWKLYIIYTPSVWQWVHLDLIKSQLKVNVICLLLVILMIIPCFTLRYKAWAEQYASYFVLIFFSVIFIRDAYLVGILSPATLAGYVCISGVGILLFNRKFLYSSVLISTAIFLSLGALTLNGTLSYAPLFSELLKSSTPPTNLFWVLSMLYFIIPILLICLILCEIMLIQWRHRETVIEKLSQTDPLTGLRNRRFFTEQIKRLEQRKLNYSIIILDLDHFKSINDRYGHSIGDDTLKCVSACLTAAIPSHDLVARYGGEEFIIALQNANLQTTLKIAERCRLEIEKLQIPLENQSCLHITASFGVAISSAEICLEQTIRYADDALYSAKQQGRNQVKIHHIFA